MLEQETANYEEQEDESEVQIQKHKNHHNSFITGLNTLQPVPTQILTLSDNAGTPIHIELDNGATVNYIRLDEAVARNFFISPNNQTSYLGDGDTILKACGEINTVLDRDKTPLTFQALVCRRLHSPAIGGTLFIRDNGIKQDFIHNTISLLNDRSTVPATTREATLPV